MSREKIKQQARDFADANAAQLDAAEGNLQDMAASVRNNSSSLGNSVSATAKKVKEDCGKACSDKEEGEGGILKDAMTVGAGTTAGILLATKGEKGSTEAALKESVAKAKSGEGRTTSLLKGGAAAMLGGAPALATAKMVSMSRGVVSGYKTGSEAVDKQNSDASARFSFNSVKYPK